MILRADLCPIINGRYEGTQKQMPMQVLLVFDILIILFLSFYRSLLLSSIINARY